MYSLILKTSDSWNASKSSEINKLNTDCLFESSNKFGFPVVKSSEGFSAEDLVPFNLCKSKKKEDSSKPLGLLGGTNADAYYKNCTAARNAGAAPLYRGDPGYRSALDGDKDGVACE